MNESYQRKEWLESICFGEGESEYSEMNFPPHALRIALRRPWREVHQAEFLRLMKI